MHICNTATIQLWNWDGITLISSQSSAYCRKFCHCGAAKNLGYPDFQFWELQGGVYKCPVPTQCETTVDSVPARQKNLKQAVGYAVSFAVCSVRNKTYGHSSKNPHPQVDGSRILPLWFLCGDNLTGASHALSLKLSPSHPSFFAPFKSRMEILWYRLTQVHLQKWPLNGREKEFMNG